MKPENVEVVIQALEAYAEAARGDYEALDGETIQWDMGEFANALRTSDPYTLEELLSRLGITKTSNGYEWTVEQ